MKYNAISLDVDIAVEYADDPKVLIIDDGGFDRNAEHGQNPELIEEGSVR